MIVRSQKIKASGGYGNSIKSCGFREGDEVKILTPDYGRGGKWYTEEYRQDLFFRHILPVENGKNAYAAA